MSVPLTLLGLLEREPSHGYDLKRDYDAYFGRDKPLPFGQVYATLGRLARDGKVVAGESEPGAGPDRKRYVITEAGVSEFETWLADPVTPEPLGPITARISPAVTDTLAPRRAGVWPNDRTTRCASIRQSVGSGAGE